jgi:hypothetical protein
MTRFMTDDPLLLMAVINFPTIDTLTLVMDSLPI